VNGERGRGGGGGRVGGVGGGGERGRAWGRERGLSKEEGKRMGGGG